MSLLKFPIIESTLRGDGKMVVQVKEANQLAYVTIMDPSSLEISAYYPPYFNGYNISRIQRDTNKRTSHSCASYCILIYQNGQVQVSYYPNGANEPNTQYSLVDGILTSVFFEAPWIIIPTKPKEVALSHSSKVVFDQSSERKVVFLNSNIPELQCFIGYISAKSQYALTNLYDTPEGYSIAHGPLYGRFEILQYEHGRNRAFYLSYETDYNGNIINQLTRSPYIPNQEQADANQGEFVEADMMGNVTYSRYYQNGQPKSDARKYIRQCLGLYLPTDLVDLIGYL